MTGGEALKRLIFISVLLCGLSGTAQATEENHLQPLPADQQKLARQMTEFMQRMDTKYFGRIEALNGGLEPERRVTDTRYSRYDIEVTRGPVIEKAGRMIAVGKLTNPGRSDHVMKWSRFYSLDIHPHTPLVGMLHAAIVMQFYENGDSFVGGWLGIMPGTRIEEDLATLKAIVDARFANNAKDPGPWRRAICEGTAGTEAKFRRQPACVGVSLYARPVFPGDTGKSYAFAAGLFDAFVDGYLDIVARRAGQAFSAADLQAQDAMRKRWLVDQLFSDPFSSKIVPFEVWSFANMPPVIKF